MSEGGLNAPVRHPIEWNDPDFYDWEKLNAETERVFDICHGCRSCFNLCDSFPRLFDLIDDSETGELDAFSTADYKQAVDAFHLRTDARRVGKEGVGWCRCLWSGGR